MEQLWEGRRTSLDFLLHVGQQRSLALDILAGRERAYRTLKKARDKVRSVSGGVPSPGVAAFALFAQPIRRAEKT